MVALQPLPTSAAVVPRTTAGCGSRSCDRSGAGALRRLWTDIRGRDICASASFCLNMRFHIAVRTTLASHQRRTDMTVSAERAVLAGGCFWGVQDLLRRYPGVISTRVGYTGGEVPNATYSNHGNHAEAIEITFDPQTISFRKLLEFFFQIHDPSTLNRQGNDRGASYRSAIFYTSDEQKRIRHYCRCRCFRPLAGQSCHRGGARRTVLGGRARASGLSGEISRRVYLSLHSAELDAAASGGEN
jgi:methionine-S-sulfoxide reductase